MDVLLPPPALLHGECCAGVDSQGIMQKVRKRKYKKFNLQKDEEVFMQAIEGETEREKANNFISLGLQVADGKKASITVERITEKGDPVAGRG